MLPFGADMLLGVQAYAKSAVGKVKLQAMREAR